MWAPKNSWAPRYLSTSMNSHHVRIHTLTLHKSHRALGLADFSQVDMMCVGVQIRQLRAVRRERVARRRGGLAGILPTLHASSLLTMPRVVIAHRHHCSRRPHPWPRPHTAHTTPSSHSPHTPLQEPFPIRNPPRVTLDSWHLPHKRQHPPRTLK